MSARDNTKDKKRRVRKVRKTWVEVLLIIILIIVTCTVVFAYRIHQNGGGLQGFLMTIFGHNRDTRMNLDKINVLILGSDDGDLADTIMVASYNPQTQDIVMFSIPRDTFVGDNRLRARPRDRINSLFDIENPQRITSVVEEMLGIEIPFYLAVEIDVFIELVDVIGGVWFDVPIDMRYDDYSQDLHIDLKQGYQLLNGQQAEQLVRFRKSNYNTTFPTDFGADDYGRMRIRKRIYSSYNEANT